MAVTNLKHGTIKTIFVSAARTVTPTKEEFVIADPAIRGIQIIVDKTTDTATPSVVPSLEIYHRVSNKWVEIKAFTAITDITADGQYLYTWYPEPLTDLGVADVDEILIFPLSTHFRFVMTHGDTDSITYSAELTCLR